MSFSDFLSGIFGSSFQEAYINPDAVFIALSMLVFILVFVAIRRTPMGEKNKGIAIVISVVLTLFFAAYFRDYIFELNVLNLVIIIVSVLVLILIVKPFFRYLRRSY